MRISLPSLVVLCGAAAATLAGIRGRAADSPAPTPRVAAPQAPNPAAQEVWGQVRARLAARPRFVAEIHQQVEAFGQRLVGSGRYLQGIDETSDPPAPLVRVELLLGPTGSYQQICDGKRIWTVSQSSGEVTLRSIDLTSVERALAAAERPPAALVAAGLAGCGLTRMIDALDRSVEFTDVAGARLRGRPVWALRGRWNRDGWISLLPQQREAIEAGRPVETSELPEQAPDHFVVYVDQRDLFPYRIDFRRNARPAYLPAGYDASPRVLFSWELVNVRFDAPLAPETFRFDPGARSFEDHTADLLSELNLKPQAAADPAPK